jgi:hypothetical protein
VRIGLTKRGDPCHRADSGASAAAKDIVAATRHPCFERDGMNKPGKANQSAARNRRLSSALRENLKRRKEQARGRTAAGQGMGEDTAAREAGVAGDEPDFRRNPGPMSDGTGRPGAGRRGS